MDERATRSMLGTMRATLVLLGCLLASHAARAQDCVSLAFDGCGAWLDEQAVSRAFEVEADARTRCEPAVATLLVSCGGGRAEVRVSGRAPESYRLATIPASVRSRVVALLLTERMREPEATHADVSTEHAARGDHSPQGRDGPEADAAPAEAEPTEATTEEPADLSMSPTPLEHTSAVTPHAPAEALSAPSPVPSRRARAPASPTPPRAHPLALVVRGQRVRAAGSPRFGVAGELTAFARPVTWVAGPVLSFGAGPVQAELGWSVGRASDVFGSMRLALLRASAGLSVACHRWRRGSLCATAWGTLGQARATANASFDGMGGSVRGPYAAAALELRASLAWTRLALSLGLRAGYGSGLVLLSGSHELAALGGALLTTTLALELAPF